ncbi:copper binding protein, plastocyanin/azurin family [Cenarchaeum symbiosum A]|uniref:Copper binding protein, plastocyanin/azurin family n=1 Tax=Cenarchaeum symbiosum (strain A) TaxID=414004 RepID=A0RTJ5_CENSY|nr:copper binding protein, plastocyanin/azurin family [Cenarchaeum symbiosum A]
MSQVRTGNAYGVGIMTVIVGVTAGAVFYQGFYLPESLEVPSVDEHILHPTADRIIDILVGSALPDQEENFVPKLVDIQLGVDNLVTWTNTDETPHTVTPDHSYADGYSGKFGSDGVLKAGETYEFLFTEPAVIEYHCQPHPWMQGTLSITKQRF